MCIIYQTVRKVNRRWKTTPFNCNVALPDDEPNQNQYWKLKYWTQTSFYKSSIIILKVIQIKNQTTIVYFYKFNIDKGVLFDIRLSIILKLRRFYSYYNWKYVYVRSPMKSTARLPPLWIQNFKVDKGQFYNDHGQNLRIMYPCVDSMLNIWKFYRKSTAFILVLLYLAIWWLIDIVLLHAVISLKQVYCS